MSRSLTGYTTIDKSLSGIITISDGGGTTISGGNITCNNITANDTITVDTLNVTTINGGGISNTPNQFVAIDGNRTDSGLYRILFTPDSNAQPHDFMLNASFRFRPSTQTLFVTASTVFGQTDGSGIVAGDYYPLLFAERTTTDGSRTVRQTLDSLSYQPSSQQLFLINLKFSGNINNTTLTDFTNNMTRTPLLYDSLGGNGTSGLGLPIWSDAYNQIIFPTNLRTYGNWVVDKASYFAEAGNVFNKTLFTNNANFNKKNFLQLCIEGTGSSGGINNVVGIDFTSWNGRTNASCRIYAQDNENYSSNLIFVTAPSGNATTTPTERMRITADGYIGIGTTNPTYQLEIAGDTKSTTLTVGNIYASAVSIASYIFCEKTTGPINICNNASFTSTITIGNNTNLTGNVNLYGADCNLYGSNWKAVTQTAGDNSTKIATTQFVQTAVTTGGVGTYLSLNSSSTQVVNSNVGVTGTLLTSTPYPYLVVGSGTNQYETVICSDDGRFVYTYAIGGKILYGSNDGGLTFSTLYTSANNINSICCNGSGKYVIVSFASLVCQYSANFGNTFQAMTIAAVTTYFPINYVSCTFENSNLYVAFTNNNTTNSRIDVYVSSTGPNGTWITSGTITGKTAYLNNHCWSNSGGSSPFLSINTLAGQEIFLLVSPYTGSPSSILSPYTFVGKIRSNYGGTFTQVPTISTLFQNTSSGAGGGYYSTVSASVSSAHCNKGGTIFVYSSTNKLYLSNNQYSELASFGSSVPTYSLLYTASGNIKDCWVSGNGMKIYFIVTGVVDTIYQISIQAPLSAYQTDFIVDKERQIVRSHKPMDTLGVFYDVLLRNKITHLTSTTTLTLPFTEFYQCDGATAFTLTLPAITDYMIGIQLTFFHMATKTITINCNASDTIVPPAATIVLTGTTYAYTPTATLNRIGLLATYCGNVSKQYAWVVL